MKFMEWRKDGGPESKSFGFFVVEAKPLSSIVLLHFLPGARDAYHTHAFGSINWLLKGNLTETLVNGTVVEYKPSWKPIITPRERFHKVYSHGDSWAIAFRGPWVDTWKEYLPDVKKYITLTHGRKVIA